MSRADKNTFTAKSKEIYSDFLDNFDKNPLTGFLARVTNEDAVKQSLKNIVLTSVGERFYDSRKGSKIRASLFDLLDPTNIEVIQIQLREAILAYEPRAVLRDIRLQEMADMNSYAVTIIFSVINIPEAFELTVNLKRVR